MLCASQRAKSVMTELPPKPRAESEPSIEFRVSCFLDAHKEGRRNPDSSVQNLSNLYETLSEKDRKRFYELLVSAYEREPFSGGAAANYTVSIPSVILRAIIVFGPVADFFPRMLDHLLSLKPEGMEEWAKAVFPVFQFNLYHSAVRFDDTTLDLIKGFHGRLSKLGGQGQAFPPQLIAAAKELERVVAGIELQKLENATRGREPLAGRSMNKKKLDNRPLDMTTISGGQYAWSQIEREYGVPKRTLGKRISFVKDGFKRKVIFRDIEQAYLLANYGFHKPAVILAGGVIEELLRLYLAHEKVKPDKDNLESYIKACETSGLIKGAIPKLADSVRLFRNIVHLAREISSRESISRAKAKGAVSSVFTIANELAT